MVFQLDPLESLLIQRLGGTPPVLHRSGLDSQGCVVSTCRACEIAAVGSGMTGVYYVGSDGVVRGKFTKK
ncbi:hypothetical protein GN244_ATG12686 [Phytophthora infestans]|uniref:Uncharacterized protein n=1 Tax=Phytophthora infestans TaxID=4787 RepID=A0A833SYH8_PHYIN|nr:hypothetical protein GN244_ATG12686 [Phytophthora infestans]